MREQAQERKTALKLTEIGEEGITGIYEGTRTGVNKQNRAYFVHTIDGQDYWGTKVTNEELSKVPEGSSVTIMYQGKENRKTKDGNAYSIHNFEVKVNG